MRMANALMKSLTAGAMGVTVGLAQVGCSERPTEPANLAPDVVITSPLDGEVFEVGDTVQIIAEASDADGEIAVVRLSIDGEQRGIYFSSPYVTSWDTSDEPYRHHRIEALAVDDDQSVSTAYVDIVVSWVYERPQQVDDGWQTAELADVGIDLAPLAGLMERLRGLPDTLVHGILIIKDGKLAFEEYLPGEKFTGNEMIQFGRDTTHNIASITKSVTSALLGSAVDRGLIESVNVRAHTLFPEYDAFQSNGKDEITFEHLITMTSGIEWNQARYHLLDPRNDIVKFYTAPDPIEYYVSRPLVGAPGTVYAYSEASINIVARGIERASGLELDEFAQEFLFSPLGITDVRWLRIRDGTWVWASGALEMRPRDMAKLGQLYLDGGVWDGQRVLSQEWIEASISPSYTLQDGRAYGYAWWLSHFDGIPVFYGSGLGQQKIYVLPDLALVVVLTGGSYWVPAVTTPEYMMNEHILPAVRGAANEAP